MSRVHNAYQSKLQMDNQVHRCHRCNQVPHRIELCAEYTSWCHQRKATCTGPPCMGTNCSIYLCIRRSPYHCRPYTTVGFGHCKPLPSECNCHCHTCVEEMEIVCCICLCKRQSLHHSHLRNLSCHCKHSPIYQDTWNRLGTGRGCSRQC